MKRDRSRMPPAVIVKLAFPLEGSSKRKVQQVLKEFGEDIPPGELDFSQATEDYRYFSISDSDKATKIAEALRKIPGVSSAFVKPQDELP